MYLNNKEIADFIAKLLKLNWSGFKLYLVGGCLEDWETKDIDICIVGKINEKLLFNNCQAARKIGPFDLYYIGEKEPYNGAELTKPITIRAAKSYDRWDKNAHPWPGEWIGKLYWRTLTFPYEKHKDRTHTYIPRLILDDCNKKIK